MQLAAISVVQESSLIVQRDGSLSAKPIAEEAQVRMAKSGRRARRNKSQSNGQTISRNCQSPKTAGTDPSDDDSKHPTHHRPMPYITILTMTSFFLLEDPRFIHPFINPGGPRWLSEATLLMGVTVTCLFTRALVAAEIRAISLGGKFHDDKDIGKLINVALSRIGLLSLWATLVGLVGLSWGSVPDELTIINTLGAYVTLGALIGFALCLYESALIYRSSLEFMRESGIDGAKYTLYVKVPDSVLMIPVVVTAFNLFSDRWVTELIFILWGCVSLRPIGGRRDLGKRGSPPP
jgi:hypothetical protein